MRRVSVGSAAATFLRHTWDCAAIFFNVQTEGTFTHIFLYWVMELILGYILMGLSIKLVTNIFIARLGIGVQVRSLTNTERSLTHTGTKMVVVPGDAVEDTAVVPDSWKKESIFIFILLRKGSLTDIVFCVPAHSYCRVVVLVKDADDPIENHLALIRGQILDVLGVLTKGINGFPSCDWVCSDYGVLVAEVRARVLNRTSVACVQDGWVVADHLLQTLRR